jgi:hypothetical protein
LILPQSRRISAEAAEVLLGEGVFSDVNTLSVLPAQTLLTLDHEAFVCVVSTHTVDYVIISFTDGGGRPANLLRCLRIFWHYFLSLFFCIHY